MRKYVFIGLGGVFGAICRYAVKEMHIFNFGGHIPWNTLIINITGSFLLALLLTGVFDLWKLDGDVRMGISTGFLGSYTTFSAFCKETVELMRLGFYGSAASYVLLSIALGLGATYLGAFLVRKAAGFPGWEKTEGEVD